jgi:diguanylate cyclase (GGDEF)-like protein
MNKIRENNPVSKANYYGRILTGNYSHPLKDYISECIKRFHAFDEVGAPAIPYISAWRENEDTIWYEFVSKRLIALLGCDTSNIPDTFKKSIIERHVYDHNASKKGIQQNILKYKMVKNRRPGLRQNAEIRGTVEAVYKIGIGNTKAFWLKDQANIESFDADKISISLGFLTIVTKEMEAEEQLKRTQNALRKSKKKFREQSIHDNLTGLYNTRYLYSALSKLISKSASSGFIFSLIFLDIDNFKYVVDTHGHLNASQVLQEIASTIKNTLNDPAYGVAYGGDEFVLVLPKFDKSRAVEMADALRTKIKETAYLQKAGLTVHVGASFGISTYPDDAQTLSELLALADQAMFSVKERGKDSVCSISYTDAKEDGTVERIFSYDCHT